MLSDTTKCQSFSQYVVRQTVNILSVNDWQHNDWQYIDSLSDNILWKWLTIYCYSVKMTDNILSVNDWQHNDWQHIVSQYVMTTYCQSMLSVWLTTYCENDWHFVVSDNILWKWLQAKMTVNMLSVNMLSVNMLWVIMLSVNMLSFNMLSVIDWQYVVSHFHWLTIYCQSFSHLLSAILRVDIVTAIVSVSSTDWQDILSDFHCHFHCLTIHCQSWQYIVSRDNTLSVVFTLFHC